MSRLKDTLHVNNYLFQKAIIFSKAILAFTLTVDELALNLMMIRMCMLFHFLFLKKLQ